MAQRLAADRLRTVELVGALSLAADLTMGQPMEHGLASSQRRGRGHRLLLRRPGRTCSLRAVSG